MRRGLGKEPLLRNRDLHGKSSYAFAAPFPLTQHRPPNNLPELWIWGNIILRGLSPSEVFAFIRFGGPRTGNHAERGWCPLVIFRKICLGSRSRTGSEIVTTFNSLVGTAELQKGNVIDLFQALFGWNATKAHAKRH